MSSQQLENEINGLHQAYDSHDSAEISQRENNIRSILEQRAFEEQKSVQETNNGGSSQQ